MEIQTDNVLLNCTENGRGVIARRSALHQLMQERAVHENEFIYSRKSHLHYIKFYFLRLGRVTFVLRLCLNDRNVFTRLEDKFHLS